jgi:D-amino peptidase
LAVEVFVSIDMEGIAGIAHIRQVMRGTDDYPRSRELMTEEANAAVAGAIEGGATRVVVNDSHGDMTNLLPDLMDPRAELTLGSPKVPHSMMTGIGANFGCSLFVGFHAGAGTEAAILDHTYSGRLLYEVRINGEPWNETDLNAALAGGYGVPVALVAGDDKCCEQAAKRLPGVRTAVVKQASGRHVATSLSPASARELIREAAAEAVRGAGSLEPFRPEPPFELEADTANTVSAELCALAPGVDRVGPRTVRFRTEDFAEAFRCLLAWTYLGASEAPRYSVN